LTRLAELVNNYHGRQLNSLNDVAINPLFPNAIYFTDSLYGALQDFRPWPTTTIPPMVYRFDPSTGAIRVVAADLNKPNGLTFSPDGSVAYVTDTGALEGFYGVNASLPATIYSYNVTAAGNFANRQTFAYVSPLVPDGIHCDEKGNVYAGTGDGVHVLSPDGVLLGKIWVGSTVANFRFTGKGRLVIAAETKLYYVNGWGVEGGDPQNQY
jgi:gluconolactonase